jgi:hypothetical protein
MGNNINGNFNRNNNKFKDDIISNNIHDKNGFKVNNLVDKN